MQITYLCMYFKFMYPVRKAFKIDTVFMHAVTDKRNNTRDATQRLVILDT